MLYGAIEAGGTKFVCAVGNAQLEVIERVSFETLNPGETMPQVVSFSKNMKQNCPALLLVLSDLLISILNRKHMDI